jgi:hypothetical protein
MDSLAPIHRLHTAQNKKRATLPFHCELSAFCEIDFPGAEEREGRHAVQHFGNPENWNTKGQKSLPEFMFGKIARGQKTSAFSFGFIWNAFDGDNAFPSGPAERCLAAKLGNTSAPPSPHFSQSLTGR